MKLIAEKAFNISVQFSEFHLSQNTILNIRTDFEITDDITAKENNSNNIWATRIYQGNVLYLTLSVPENEIAETKIILNKIGFGFRQVGGGFFGNPGASGNCNINVLCPAGNGWQNERNSVALIVSGINEICTGTLVMNTCGNNIPYLLTANHCLNSSVSNWVFQFQTWSTDCNTNIGWREDVQFNGCQLRANNEATDFALVELNQTPLVNSGLTYSGWTRNPNPAITTTGIHHPSGDLMKICHDFQSPVSVSWFGGASDHWRAIFDQGIVQHGSSGSALYDENHRIIGQLHGNQNNICNIGDNNCFCNVQIPSIGEYGRFDLSWTGGGTNSTRLSNWLDPDNTGAMNTNTTNINQLAPAIPVLTISGNTSFCSGTASYTLNYNGVPYAGNVSWVSSDPSIASISPSGNPATLTKNGNGQVTITATLTQCGIQYTHNKTIDVGLPEAPEFIEIYGNGADDPLYLCPGGYRAEAFTTKSYPQYEWLLPSTWTSSVSGGNNPFIVGTLGFDIPIHVYSLPSTEYMRVRTINGCGYSTPVFLEVGTDCGGYRMSNYTISPNPAKGHIKIDGSKHNKLIREIQIVDKLGNIKLLSKYSQDIKFVNLNISKLNPDIYYIKIYDGHKWESKIIKID